MTRRSHTDNARVLRTLGAPLLTATLLLAGCASAGSGATGSQLERLAQRELARPDARAQAAPPPESIRLEPADPNAAPWAYKPLDDAIEHFAGLELPMMLLQGEVEDERPVSEDDRARALRRYIAGRSALVGDDPQQAIEQLSEAAGIDPTEPRIWRSLGDAHWATGDRLTGIASYLRAIRLDPDDTVSLMRVGLSEADRRSQEAAATLLARAERAIRSGNNPDAAVAPIVGVTLGRTLHELGWLRAGNESIEHALEDLSVFSQPTSYRRELGSVIRVAGDAWRDAGDASMRLGDPESALAQYRTASELPSFDPAAILARRVYANMKLGRPAPSAMLLVDRIAELNGLVDDRTLELIRYVAGVSEVGAPLSASIAEVEQSLTSDQRRLAASQLARARAAALPDDEAIAVLIDRLIVAPSDEAAVSDLLNRRSPGDAPGLVALVSRLIGSNTVEADRYTGALIRYTQDLAPLIDAAGAIDPPTLGGSLLGAALHAEVGETGSAYQMLEEAEALRPGDPGVTLARATLAIRDGDTEQARSLLGEIDIEENQASALAVAKVYRELGDNETAMSILNDRVWGGDATAEEAQVAGLTSMALGSPLDAEQLFKLAIELDPTLEDAYAGLITLYSNAGPLANQADLGDVLRALREAIPSSRTLRWLRAQDLLRADRLDQALRELLSLAEESLDPVITEQLVTVWIRTGASETAQRWLTEQIRVRPNRSILVRLLARVEASRGDTAIAIATLERWMAEHPGDDDASRELEGILRLDPVNRPDDADALALKRLRRSAPSVRRAIELAPILIRQGMPSQAIEELDLPMREGMAINPGIAQSYAQLVGGVATFAAQRARAEPELAEEGLAMLSRFLELFPDVNAGMHRTYVMLLAETKQPTDRIIQAVIAAGEANPSASDDFTLDAFQRLIQIGEDEKGYEVITGAARGLTAPPPRLLAIWLYLTIDNADAEMSEEALAMIDRLHQGVETASSFNDLDSRLELPIDGDEQHALAELAYTTAANFTGRGPEGASERFYAIALEHNPRHAMANNNLAYGWVERDTDLDRAHEMLKIAHEEDPSSDAITDSLGWVRYKLGMIDDQRDAEGRIVMQGAVSLLNAAAQLSTPVSSAEIHDHLADALWRMGKTDLAIEAWQVARTALLAQLDIPQRPEPVVEALREQLAAVESKLDAVASGEIPPLAPMIRPRRWTQENPEANDRERIDNTTTREDASQGAPL